LPLGAELAVKKLRSDYEAEVPPQRRNLDMMLFFDGACVKDNRQIPLCKGAAKHERLTLIFAIALSVPFDRWSRHPTLNCCGTPY
jgi:hypothetical protein